MLQRIAHLAIAAPRLIIAVAALLMICAAVFGVPVIKDLSAAGFRDPNAESSEAIGLLSEKFGQGDLQMVFTVHSDAGAHSDAARLVGTDIVDRLKASAFVAQVTSAWTDPPPKGAALTSRTGTVGLVVAGVSGGGTDGQRHAKTLAQELVQDRDGVTVKAGGPAMAYVEINHESEHDLLLVESIAIPLSFIVLVWIFGGLLAAALPLAVGMFSIVGSMATLRGIALATEVSTFALNLTVAMGLALAIDYTLLIISRFRDERADGAERDEALITTMTTAGRTVLFSAMTVGFSMVALVLFPMYFLKSFAYAGVAVVGLTAVAALVLTPAAIVLLDDRIYAFDLRRPVRRLLHRSAPGPQSIEQNFWYRSTKFAMRQAIPVGVAVIALLLLLGAPFLHVRWGFPDDRILPTSASARQVGNELRDNFAEDQTTAVTVVIPDISDVPRSELARYATDLSLTFAVTSVSSPVGTYVNGVRAGRPSAPTGISDDSAFLTVNSRAPLFSKDSEGQLAWIHAVVGPGNKQVKLAGTAQVNHDNAVAITARLPLVLAVMAAITFVLLFVLTGSVVLPAKALVLNMLSLTAAFGALVWIFQDGHLGALGTASTGTLVANVPVLLFCIAFGLSMDYEVFLISRIREYWLCSESAAATTLDRRRSIADNDESVALGLARTGRVVTAAALVMSISFAALIAADVSILRMFGLGLTLAVLMDATLVRLLLLPAFMHVLGRANWWAPQRLVQLHTWFGVRTASDTFRARRPRHRTPRRRMTSLR